MLQSKNKYFFALILLMIVTIFVYYPTFENGFTNLDDNMQVTENPDIRSLSLDNIITIFSSNYVGMYQPVTTLIFAIEYAVFGLNPIAYHSVSLLFHLLNIILVFYFISILYKNKQTAILVSALFALHPLYVEAIGWVSARSTLTYSFFYLLSLIYYLKYKSDSYKKWFYILSLLFFIFSVMAKAMAITLPVILFLIDYFQNRKFNYKSILEKAPYFLFAIVLGLIAIFIRENVGDLNSSNYYFGFGERLIISFYQIAWYFIMAFFPISLSAYYPDPLNLKFIYYLSPLFIIGIAFLIVYLKKIRKQLIFACLFLIISMGIVLKIFLFFDQNVTGRYTYLAYIGLFVLFVSFLQKIKSSKFSKLITVVPILILLSFFIIQTNTRIRIYKSSFTLWNDVLTNYPESYFGYINLGDAYKNEGNYEIALIYVNKGLKYYKAPKAYLLRGYLYSHNNQLQESLQDYNQAILLNPVYYQAYSNRGNLYLKMNNISAAFDDFNIASDIKPDNAELYYNKAIAFDFSNNPKSAIENYSQCIELNPYFTDAYINRSIDYLLSENFSMAMADINTSISLLPQEGKLYMIRAEIFQKLKDPDKACSDFKTAFKLGFSEAENEIEKYCMR
ncbi:MAG: hypothetical protein ABIJ97_17615 [Bacteroidota bacterium]